MARWSPWESVTRQVAIAGRVTNAQTDAEIVGANITITAAPEAVVDRLVTHAQLTELPNESDGVQQAREQLKNSFATNEERLGAAQMVLDFLQEQRALPVFREDRTISGLDGRFHFMDLPDGDYVLTAKVVGMHRRYAPVQGTVTVLRQANGRIEPEFVELAMPATTLWGRITMKSPDDGEFQAVTLAEIRIQGTGESTFSDLDGTYKLVGLEAADKDAADKPAQTVLVKAEGYRTVKRSIVFQQPGDSRRLNLRLKLLTDN